MRYNTVNALASALRRASDTHHKYEESIGKADQHWPEWYAEFMMNEEAEPQIFYSAPNLDPQYAEKYKNL